MYLLKYTNMDQNNTHQIYSNLSLWEISEGNGLGRTIRKISLFLLSHYVKINLK